jgi:hypothetical protein
VEPENDANPPTFDDGTGEEDAFESGERPHGAGQEGTPTKGRISASSVERRRPGTSTNPAS